MTQRDRHTDSIAGACSISETDLGRLTDAAELQRSAIPRILADMAPLGGCACTAARVLAESGGTSENDRDSQVWAWAVRNRKQITSRADTAQPDQPLDSAEIGASSLR